MHSSSTSTRSGALRRLPSITTLAALAAGLSGPAWAEPAAAAGVLRLSASATIDVPRDWMSLSFSVSRDGADAATVQAQLKQALDTALAEARKVARPGQIELQSGGFSIFPRYGSKGQINGWQGSTQLVVEGRDMAGIGQLSGRISSMAIAGVDFGLSREAREQVESAVTAQAIARFRARAAEQARAFGYAEAQLREVAVTLEPAGGPTPRLAMASAMRSAPEAAPLQSEPGKGSVTANVSGSVQLR